MKANLFKNFKSLKEKEAEMNLADVEKMDNVSVKSQEIEKDKKTNKSEKSIKTSISDIVLDENIVVTKKNRPIKKEILEAKELLREKQNEGANSYAKTLVEDDSKRTYTVFLEESSLEFIKDLVFYKATAERQIFYNQSEALVEAIDILQKEYKNIGVRPDFIRKQEKTKKGGRKRNSETNFSMTTTVYIPGGFYEFIKDFTYNKVVGGDMYYKDWDLLELGVEKLREKYGKKIKPRPDYIREDEKLRGRKSKDKS